MNERRVALNKEQVPSGEGRKLAAAMGCALIAACSLQGFDELRSGIGADAGLGGPITSGGTGGDGGDGGTAGSLGGDGGSAAGDGGAGGTSDTGGTAGASGSSGSGGAGGSGGSGGTGGVGGAAGFLNAPDPDAGPDPNLIQDPGFEQGIGLWVGWGSQVLTVESEGPLAGTQSLRSSARVEPWVGPSYYLTNDIIAGVTYDISAWIRTPHTNVSMQVTAKVLCAGQAASTFIPIGTFTSQNYWQEFHGSFVGPACTLQEFRIYFEQAPAGEDIYLDEVRVVAVG